MREVRIRVHEKLGMIHVMSAQEDQMQLDTFRSAADSRWSIETAVTWALESMEHVESMESIKHVESQGQSQGQIEHITFTGR